MICDDVCYLIAQTPDTHGFFDDPAETERMVFCAVRSVGRSEYYRAREIGLNPEIVIDLSDSIEYQGEKALRYKGRRYDIVRTYVDGRAIELTVEEAKANG